MYILMIVRRVNSLSIYFVFLKSREMKFAPIIQGESKRTGPSGKKILKIDVNRIFEKLVSGI